MLVSTRDGYAIEHMDPTLVIIGTRRRGETACLPQCTVISESWHGPILDVVMIVLLLASFGHSVVVVTT